ncbi:MAG: hypothetical protein VKP70_01560 [Cyanobacteriota bacterium]|nr:hypothetical protein [Cyanobacteriota bacterium]
MPLEGFPAKSLAHPLVWAVLLGLALSAIFFDAFPYDVLAYHGPFASLATGLPRLANYGMTLSMEHRFQGFPPLWRWLLAPGLGLGLPRLMAIPNLAALGALAWSARATLRIPWFVSSAAALLFPIALFGFRTPYQDFFVGALTAAAVLWLMESLRHWAESGQGARAAWIALPLVLAASLTKFQGLFQVWLALALTALAVAVIGWRRGRPAARWWLGPLPVLLLTLLLSGLHPLHNLLAHHNPFFPIAAGPFAGPEMREANASPAYTSALGPLQTFLNHWLSASELDWIARGVVPSYTLDQARAQTQYGGLVDPRALTGLVRSGGSFGPAYLAAMAAYGVAFVQALGQWRRTGTLSAQGWPVLAVAPLLLLAPGLPQSHELRYYLALLTLPALTALGWWWEHGSRRWLELGLLSLLSIALLLNFSQPLHSTINGLRKGQGLQYAVGYPTRDLPSVQDCLRPGGTQPRSVGTLRLPAVMAFGCRLQVPGEVRVEELEGSTPSQVQPEGGAKGWSVPGATRGPLAERAQATAALDPLGSRVSAEPQ